MPVRLGMPATPSTGFGVSLPLGVLLHLALVALLLHSSANFSTDQLPAVESYRVRLFAPPAAAPRLGDSAATPNAEDLARTPRETPRQRPPRLVAHNELLQMLDRIETPSFGVEHGIPEGIWDGLEFGTADGVTGGIPGGVRGGQIGGLSERADPVLPPPDEPPAAISMPRPDFPMAALRDGVRGRVVLRALITERGTVEVLRILRSVPRLDAEAVRVVESEWRFRPAQRNGRPVAALSNLVVRFSLR